MTKNCTDCTLGNNQNPSTEEIQHMTQYVPFKIVKLIGKSECCIFEHKIEQQEGTIIYFDIIGFTPIVVNYINANRDIADLSGSLSEFYSVIIETIREFGGSIFQFAGDSLLICFELLENETKVDNFKRAFAAMIRALELSDNYNTVTKDANGFVLKPKIGIGCGTFYQLLLGNSKAFISPVLVGSAVADAINCERKCTKQELVVTREVMQNAELCGLQDCFLEVEGLMHLISIPEGFSNEAPRPDYFPVEDFFELPLFYNRLSAFLNPVIRQQTQNSYEGFGGEYKDVTCIMANFSGSFSKLHTETDIKNSYNALDTIYLLMQNKAYRYGGYCMKPDISDKGVVFPIVFGTPAALEQKERNALLCALEILDSCRKNANVTSVNIGISTGLVYSGEFGGFLRKDYTVIGNSINFASRLMMYSVEKKTYSLFMDTKTFKSVETICSAERFDGITCKGFSESQTAYLFTGSKISSDSTETKKLLIGRENELSYLSQKFEEAVRGKTCVVSIIGDAGMGKTYLANHFLQEVVKKYPDSIVMRGYCFQYEESTVFYCWRPIIMQLMNLPAGISDNKTELLVQTYFAKNFPMKAEWVPVLLNMIGFDFPETSMTSDMDVSLKQYQFFSIVAAMFALKAKESPIIVYLEDIHWGDAVSLNMISYLNNSIDDSKMLIIGLGRDENSVSNFFSMQNFDILRLCPITTSAATLLTKHLLNMEVDEPLLVKKIVSTSDGNPFFIESIVLSLIESGTLIKNSSGQCQLSKNIKSIQNIVIPSSIQNIVLSRLNSLKFEEQVVCKTAAAIGRTFFSDCLKELLPEGISEQSIENALTIFESNDIIERKEKQDSEYTFKHVITHDVIYDTILDATKRELNLMILSYLENRYADNLLSIVERLEYHAIEAKEYNKVFMYAVESAKKSEKQFSFINAINHYITAINAWEAKPDKSNNSLLYSAQAGLAEAYRVNGDYDKATDIFTKLVSSCKDRDMRANALAGLGHCYQEQGYFSKSVSSLERSLLVLGKIAPKSLIAVYCAILREAVHQLYIYGLKKCNLRPYTGTKYSSAEVKLAILCVLNKLYYFGLPEKIAWSSLANFNNAVRMGSQAEKRCIAAGDYAVSLVSAGFTSLGKKIFAMGDEWASKTSNITAANVFKARYAYYFLFYNNPAKSIELLEEATAYFRKIGELWELMTAEGALAQNYFLIGDFKKSEDAYSETNHVAETLHSPMHIGWAYNKLPFIRYINNGITAAEAELQLTEGIKLSDSVHDHMTLCIHYGHLAYIAIQENDFVKALNYAEHILDENRIYKINIPHVKISLVNAVEAICAAHLHNAIPENRKHFYFTIAQKSLKKVLLLSKSFLMLAGPAARASAAFAMIKNDKQKALEQIHISADILKDSPYIWEYENTLKFEKLIQNF